MPLIHWTQRFPGYVNQHPHATHYETQQRILEQLADALVKHGYTFSGSGDYDDEFYKGDPDDESGWILLGYADTDEWPLPPLDAFWYTPSYDEGGNDLASLLAYLRR